jgi:hypothetical protein
MLVIDSAQYHNYINGNWSNVAFTRYTQCSGNLFEAWVESNPSNISNDTTVWVRLTPPIAANSTSTIYMNFMKTNEMSGSDPTGGAPQLSAVYGAYDDGPLVFSFYDNFNGTKLSNLWTHGGGGFGGGNAGDNPATATVNDGLKVNYSGTGFGGGEWDWVQSSATFNPQSYVMDSNSYLSGLTPGGTEEQIGPVSSDKKGIVQYVVSEGNLEYNGSSPVHGYYILLANPNYHTSLVNGCITSFQSSACGATLPEQLTQ